MCYLIFLTSLEYPKSRVVVKVFEEEWLLNLFVTSAVMVQSVIVFTEFVLMCCSKVSLCRRKWCHELERGYGHSLYLVTKYLQCWVQVTNLQFKCYFYQHMDESWTFIKVTTICITALEGCRKILGTKWIYKNVETHQRVHWFPYR